MRLMRLRTYYTRILVSCLLLLAGSIAVAKDPPVASVTPEVALARLKEGNARFVAQAVSAGKPTAARRAETANSQRRLRSSSVAPTRGPRRN